ncbi:MAG: SHOCT domain-containing protein [Dermatophilaceae bacterium]
MPGLIRGVARTAVVAGTATAVSNRVSRRQANRWSNQAEEAQYAQQPQYAPPPEAAPPEGMSMDEKVAQLKQLAELKDQGILTDKEFEAQKAKILGQ